jgi:cytochrome c peroxidase
LLLSLLFGAPAAVVAHGDHDKHAAGTAEQPSRAPGYGTLGFDAPAAGTYSLPSLGLAADGEVVDSGGKPARLRELMAGKLVLLSFIYTSCSDVSGCPLATYALGRVQEPIAGNPLLRDRILLLTLSFDPLRDTPPVMAKYGAQFRRAGFDWRFLATRNQADLDPILEAYGQWVAPERDARGRVTGTFSHLLRVYLIDDRGRIRNIYNANFLHPDILVNDLLTVVGAGN